MSTPNTSWHLDAEQAQQYAAGRVGPAMPAHVIGEHAEMPAEERKLEAPHRMADRERVAEHDQRPVLGTVQAIVETGVFELDAGHGFTTDRR